MKADFPFPVQQEKYLREFSTFQIGGPALYFTEATSCEQMQQMLAYAHQVSLPVFILGKGSNCLFDDRGFDGLVIRNRIDYLHYEEGIFTAGSGYSFPRLGKISTQQGWKGLEFASGIPATVGGAIYMNAGAHGEQTSASLVKVGYVTEEGTLIYLQKNELTFEYRTSCFQKWKGAIVEGIFSLTFSEEGERRRKEILNDRLKTQPYGDKSAGCVFRNPLGLAAGKLIEDCGLKGRQRGGAMVSEVHANFIINKKNSTASDVLCLIDEVKTLVYKQRGILLEEEIRYVPYTGQVS